MQPIRISPDAAIEELLAFNGKLASGLRHLAELREAPDGVTPKEVVYQEDKLTLYRFVRRGRRGKSPRHTVPLLIVYALVNRPYMTDLQADRSLVGGLLDAGIDVYLIDWGYPDQADRFLTLDDYINGYVDRCVDEVRRRHDLPQIDILGICQGGTFSLCYASLHSGKVGKLVTMVTPVDFHTPDNLLSKWMRHIDVDQLVDTVGNVPGELLNWTFLALKPFRLMGQKYLDLVEVLDDREKLENFLRMEKWIFDSPDQAGAAFGEFVKDFFQHNKLVAGAVELGGRRVDLGALPMPILNVYATEDHLVPPKAARALANHVPAARYSELAFQGGHIGIYVSARAQRQIPPAIAGWLRGTPP